MIKDSERFRLLPWLGPEGQQCYLDGLRNGPMARLADEVEHQMLDTGQELLELSDQLMSSDTNAGPEQLRFVLARLREALSDTLRIAASRGARLADDEPADDEDILSALLREASE